MLTPKIPVSARPEFLQVPPGESLYIFPSVCTESLVLSFVSLTSFAISLNLFRPVSQTCSILVRKKWRKRSKVRGRGDKTGRVKPKYYKHLLGNRRVPHTFIQPPLTRRHHRPLPRQAPQRHAHLPRMATAHPVRQHIHAMPLGQQV